MPLVFQPIDQIAHAQLAERLACWAKTASGMTDLAVQYQSCCVSPTGQTLGRWVVPNELCEVYGPLNFTGNDGEVIPCPPIGSAEYVLWYIYDDDVDSIDPNTCEEVILAAPLGLTSPTQGPTTVDLEWDAVDGAETYVVRWSLAGMDDWTELPPTALTSAEVTGLDDETSYDFQVQALAVGAVDSPWSATLTQATTSLGTLAAPTGLASPAETGTTMDVSWNATDNATGYVVEWSLAGMGTWTTATNADTTYTITGLTAATSYDVRVKATAPGWTDSVYSATLTNSTAAGLLAPAGLASPAQTETTVGLSWTAATNAATYVVRWSPAGAGTWTELAPAAGTTANVTGLTGSTSYDFQVKSQAPGWVDSGWTASLTPSTEAPLAAPAGLASPDQTTTTVDLTWSAVTDAATYMVRWSPAGAGTWTELSATASTSQTVSGLTLSTSYDFEVKALAPGYNDSAWSTTLTQSTAAELLAPASFAAGTPTETTVPLTWDAAVNADTYTAAWSLASGEVWTDVAPTALTNQTMSGLDPSTAYQFRVKSQASGFTDSAWASPVNATTLDPALAAPTGLDTTGGILDTSIIMSWNSVTDADDYVMRWSPAGAGTWTQLPPTASTSDTATGLTPSTSYDLQVKARGTGWSDSAWSATHTVSTTATPQLDPPSGVSSPSQSSSSVDLTWTPIVDADTYVVRWSPAGAGTWTELSPSALTTQTVSGLDPTTSYDFEVKAQGTGWIDSAWSTTFTQSTTG